ncbi:MAG: hypothetical protein FRX49_10387 [Trebouxia sp. A1-2]|nr:MAG: hypothetical protein FRX49_10387 [Trebouxia sp. A1-2]
MSQDITSTNSLDTQYGQPSFVYNCDTRVLNEAPALAPTPGSLPTILARSSSALEVSPLSQLPPAHFGGTVNCRMAAHQRASSSASSISKPHSSRYSIFTPTTATLFLRRMGMGPVTLATDEYDSAAACRNWEATWGGGGSVLGEYGATTGASFEAGRRVWESPECGEVLALIVTGNSQPSRQHPDAVAHQLGLGFCLSELWWWWVSVVRIEGRQWTTDCSLSCQQAWHARLVKRDGCEWLRHAENGRKALAGDGGQDNDSRQHVATVFAQKHMFDLYECRLQQPQAWEGHRASPAGAELVLGGGREVRPGQGQGQDVVQILRLQQGLEDLRDALMGTAGLIHRIELRQGEAYAWPLLVGQLQQCHQLQSQLLWLRLP